MNDITDVVQKLDALMQTRLAKDEAIVLIIEALRQLNGGKPAKLKR
jgi:hypothetical protein